MSELRQLIAEARKADKAGRKHERAAVKAMRGLAKALSKAASAGNWASSIEDLPAHKKWLEARNAAAKALENVRKARKAMMGSK